MLIKSLTIHNYGRHKHLELKDLTAPIIGIVGANGNGKSTILKAISFAFKGKEDDSAIADKITLGESSGFIDLVFEKNNTEGRIIRKFGTTDSASFKWGSESFTRKTEINKKIDEILGVDKQVLSNTIFIKQGEILELVESTPSKRVELFSKLLNLDYFNKRCASVGNNAKQLKDSVKDVQTLKDSITELTEKYNSLQTEIDSDISNFNKNFISIEFVTQLVADIDKYKNYLSDIEQIENTIVAKCGSTDEITVKRLLQSNSQLITSKQDIQDKLIEKEKFLRAEAAKILDVYNYKHYLESLARSCTYVDSYQLSLLDTITNDVDINNFSNLNEAFKAYEKALETQKDIYKDWIVNVTSFTNYLEFFNQSKKESESLNITLEQVSQQLEKVFEEKRFLQNNLEQLQSYLNLKTKLKDKLNKDSKCPICGLQLILGQTITEQELDKLREDIKNVEQKLDYTTSDFAAKGSLKDFIKAQIVTTDYKKQNAFAHLLTNYEKILALKPYDENLPDKLSSEENVSKLKTFKLLETAASNAKLKFVHVISNPIRKPNNTPYMDMTKSSLEGLLKSHDTSLGDIINSIESVTGELAELKSEESRLKLLSSLYECMKTQKEVIQTNINNLKLRENLDKLIGINKTFQDLDLDATYLYLKDAINTYKSIDNKTINKNYINNSITQTQSLYDKNLKANNDVFETISTLNDLGESLNIKNNQSLPRAYINYLFKHICNNVKESLMAMDSDFIIDVDETEDLAFKYKRTFELDKDWLKMSSLSGGQKVRLSIAILIAIQKIICPDLGFLVLDEPSTHLDTDSVEALATMLTDLEKIVKISNSQIWFVDHNVALERACDIKIKL